MVDWLCRAHVVARLRALCNEHGTQKAAAAAIGITAIYFSDVMSGKRNPGPKVLTALGLRGEQRYEAIR